MPVPDRCYFLLFKGLKLIRHQFQIVMRHFYPHVGTGDLCIHVFKYVRWPSEFSLGVLQAILQQIFMEIIRHVHMQRKHTNFTK